MVYHDWENNVHAVVIYVIVLVKFSWSLLSSASSASPSTAAAVTPTWEVNTTDGRLEEAASHFEQAMAVAKSQNNQQREDPLQLLAAARVSLPLDLCLLRGRLQMVLSATLVPRASWWVYFDWYSFGFLGLSVLLGIASGGVVNGGDIHCLICFRSHRSPAPLLEPFRELNNQQQPV